MLPIKMHATLMFLLYTFGMCPQITLSYHKNELKK
jgi:hypothetical protein